MEPFAKALLAHAAGDSTTELLIHRDDGLDVLLPVRHFFRGEEEFSDLEQKALSLCSGHVLDVGAGAGIHSLVLQGRGIRVTALDLSPLVAELLRRRGVEDVVCSDFLDFKGGPFDSITLFGHGIGMAGTLAGLDPFLTHAGTLLNPRGWLLVDSLDVTATDDPRHLQYQEQNRRAGRYVGETRIRFGHAGEMGPYCPWLHIDPSTLSERASPLGFAVEVVCQEESGEYLARLTKR